MRANSCIAGCTLLLVLNLGTAQHAFSAAAPSPASSGQVAVPRWKSITEDPATWRREPFRNPVTSKSGPGTPGAFVPAAASSGLALQGIMKSNTRYYAIINGTTVRAGDRIDGWSVAAISSYRVTLRRDKEQQIYDIYQGKIDRGTR